MSSLLLDRTGFGIIPAFTAPPTAGPDFDDRVLAAGATSHVRFLHPSGTTAEDVIGSADFTLVNAVAWQRGALVSNAAGNSAFFDANLPTPTYFQRSNFITSATWAVGIVCQLDRVQAKHVLLCSGSADGGYSLEVEADGAGGLRFRQFTRVSGAANVWTTGAGTAPVADAFIVFFVQLSDASVGGRFIYRGGPTGFDLVGSNTTVRTFTAVPNGTHFCGAWNVSGGLQAPLRGLVGELILWNGSVPTEAEMEDLSRLQSVGFAGDFSAGSVDVGQTLTCDVGPNTNPGQDFTPVKVTDPSAGGGSVAVVGETFHVTGHATEGNYSFDYRISRQAGALLSNTATISYSVTDPEGSPSGGGVNGITLPQFEFQTISDSVPSGAIWLDPASGNNSNNGLSKANAKATFAGAQSAIGAGGTIVLVGGRHDAGTLTFTKSGTSGNRLTLMAEPNTEVVLYGDGDFAGALEQTWAWTQVDAGLNIWQSPNIGGLPKTVVNNNSGAGNVSNGLQGILKIPNGPFGRPHLMFLPWSDRDGDYAADAFRASRTSNQLIKNGGYGGPCLYAPGDGRIQIRMQPPGTAYVPAEWPSDGIMGSLVNSSGAWVQPATDSDPNDFEIFITRFTGDFGGTGPIVLNLNGQSWWHIKGINIALANIAVTFPAGSENNLFENCTWFTHGLSGEMFGNCRNNTFRRVMFMTGAQHHLSWPENKHQNYWHQHLRTNAFRGASKNANTGTGTRFEHCTFYGWFDTMLSMDTYDGDITLDHCAVLMTYDDGFTQQPTDGPCGMIFEYCYIAGGPWFSGDTNQPGPYSRDWYAHHCVYDGRIPMMWGPPSYGTNQTLGVKPNKMYPIHGGGADGPSRVMKMWNCTMISAPDTPSVHDFPLGSSPAGHNVPSGRALEVYNCIKARIAPKRYNQTLAKDTNDDVLCRMSCQRSSAGTQRYDYNCYFRNVPGPQSSFCFEIQNSRNAGLTNFSSLADFRSSSMKTTSESMYQSGTGGFSGAIGIDGHEAHGVQVNPGFVSLPNRDYRPTHASVTSGHLNVSSSGWPGAADAHSWKGACDPNGDGSEIGPQPE